MSQGYIFFGIDQYKETKNIDCAYALSISLKIQDPSRETCVVVNRFEDVPKKYEKGFDYIVAIPYGRTEPNHHDFRIDWWQLYYASPFEETIYLDTYSLAIDNISSLWDSVSNEEFLFSQAIDYRGDTVRNDFLFQTQDQNKLVAFDTRMIYFKESKVASEFFKIADPIIKNWRTVYSDLLTGVRVSDFDLTLILNFTFKIVGDDVIVNDLFDYTDATIDRLWDPELDEEIIPWRKKFNVWFADDGALKLNNYRQTGIFYYDDPAFITKDKIAILNDNFRKTKKTTRA